ncbi:DMT family transporter [bacterium]|nr:DMT family transporter [bacterium]MBT5988711.1 DMT family transporter [bacterium]MBT7088521.1 DMT family transporter [bacterium]
MDEKTKHFLQLNLAFLLLSTGGIFAKLMVFPPVFINFARAVVAGTILFFIIFFIKKEKILPKNKKDLFGLLVIGFFMAIHWITVIVAVKISTVAITMLAVGLAPIFTVFIEPLFFRTKLNRFDILLATIAFGGLLMMIPEFSLSNQLTIGAILGAISALALSIRSVISRKYVQKYGASLLMFYQLLVTAIVSLPFIWGGDLGLANFPSWMYLVLLAILGTLFGHTLLVHSFKHFTVSKVTIQSNLITVYAIILAMLVLHEIPHVKTLFGGTVIVAVAIAEAIRHNHMSKKSRLN